VKFSRSVRDVATRHGSLLVEIKEKIQDVEECRSLS
jgi:hypothetical protein